MYVSLYKRGKYYYVTYKNDGRLYRRSLGITDKRAAELKRAEIEKQLAIGVDPLKKTRSTSPLSKLTADYLQHCTDRGNSEKTLYEKTIHLGYLNNLFSSVADIDESKINAYLNGQKPAQRNRLIATYRHFGGYLVSAGVIEENPFAKLKKVKENKKTITLPTPQDFERILDAADDDLRDGILIIANTGLRPGDVLTLKKKHINLGDRLISKIVNKTRKPIYIPINETLYGVLARRLEALNDDDWLFGFGSEHLASFRSKYDRARAKAGVNGIRLYDFRHLFACNLLRNMVNIRTVQELMGHSDISTTQIYLHVIDEEKRKAVETIAQITHN